MEALDALNLEHKILFLLFIIAYAMAMAIQVRDPDVKVHWSDFPIVFFTSAIGATIAYFIAFSWLNVGWRMAVTILVSLMFPRTFMFLLSKESQEEFSKGFFQGIISILKNVFNSKSEK